MSLRPALDTQVRAGLLLTPGMQLGLKVLQASKTELRELAARELEANPLLELHEEEPEEDAAPAVSDADGRTGAGTPGPGDDTGEGEDGGPWWRRERECLPRAGIGVEAWASRPPGFRELLHGQFRAAERRPEVLFAGEYLIGCLDERGYLAVALEEAARDLRLPLQRCEQALAVLQGLEPAGVGARDLRECLLLQIRHRPDPGGWAGAILEHCYPDLVRGRWGSIQRRLRISPGACRAAVGRIRRLCPRPASALPGEKAPAVDPDLIVERAGEGYEIHVNERGLLRLRLAPSWREWTCRPAPEAAEFLSERLRAARWFLTACRRRRATLVRVMECILEAQRGFFERGVEGMQPLTRREAARRLGLHESTVARVARDKYVQTPRGTYPLGFFFGGGPGRGRVDAASARAVQEHIRRLCREEDPGAPRSDEEIARILRQGGLRVARRTVAKYRARLGLGRAAARGGLAAGNDAPPRGRIRGGRERRNRAS